MHFSLLDSHFRQFCEIQISTTFVYIFWADRQLTELMSECARRKTQLRCFDVNELRLEDNEHFWRWVQTFDETSSKRRKITMKKKRRKQQIDGKTKLFIIQSIFSTFWNRNRLKNRRRRTSPNCRMLSELSHFDWIL